MTFEGDDPPSVAYLGGGGNSKYFIEPVLILGVTIQTNCNKKVIQGMLNTFYILSFVDFSYQEGVDLPSLIGNMCHKNE